MLDVGAATAAQDLDRATLIWETAAEAVRLFRRRRSRGGAASR